MGLTRKDYCLYDRESHSQQRWSLSNSISEEIPLVEQLGEESTAPNSTLSECLRRSTWKKQKPDGYSHNLTLLSTKQQDPSSVTEAKWGPDKVRWTKTMEREMESLWLNKVWELLEPPPNWKVIGSKCVFKWKANADSSGTLQGLTGCPRLHSDVQTWLEKLWGLAGVNELDCWEWEVVLVIRTQLVK